MNNVKKNCTFFKGWLPLADMTLACEDANSKLVDAVTVAVDAEESVGDNLVEILKLMFCQNIVAVVWSIFLS